MHSGEIDKCMGDIGGYFFLRVSMKCTAGRYEMLAPLGHTNRLEKFLATRPRKCAETKKRK